MKVSFIHKENLNIMESIQVTRDRMDEIVSTSQKKMIEMKPNGMKSELLDYMIRECNDTNEVIAATIVWQAITGQMETQKTFDAMKELKAKQEFRDRISIHKNENNKDGLN